MSDQRKFDLAAARSDLKFLGGDPHAEPADQDLQKAIEARIRHGLSLVDESLLLKPAQSGEP